MLDRDYEMIAEAQACFDRVTKKVDEMLPRTRRKATKKLVTERPLKASDMGLEASEEV